MMRWSRIKARAYARHNGYFWLPCPLCGEHFGGHEWLRDTAALSATINTDTPGIFQGICPKCTLAGKGDKK